MVKWNPMKKEILEDLRRMKEKEVERCKREIERLRIRVRELELDILGTERALNEYERIRKEKESAYKGEKHR